MRSRNPPDIRIIKPLAEAIGPVTPLRDIVGRQGVDAVVRAIAGGLTVYDAGRVLMANEGVFNILRDILAMDAA